MYDKYNRGQMENQEFLNDEKEIRGKKKKIEWRKRKMSSLEVSASYKRLGNMSKAFRMNSCGDILEFVRQGDKKKLIHAHFCKIRLCPMCAWRRSLKTFAQVSQVMNEFETNRHAFLFLTLTCRNVGANGLKETMDKLFSAFNDLTHLKKFRQAVVGWFRALEVTYNHRENTYHPHFHCILAVRERYFKDVSYISHGEWVSLWQGCLGANYIPVVDIRRFKKTAGKEIAEVSKYAVKPEDYIIRYYEDNSVFQEKTDTIIDVLDKALFRRRLVAFGGEFKKIHKRLNLDDIEDGDLVVVDGKEELRDDVKQVIEIYRWHVGLKNYVLDSAASAAANEGE